MNISGHQKLSIVILVQKTTIHNPDVKIEPFRMIKITNKIKMRRKEKT